ncbi:MAG: isocitrate/isopropylmalate dehydrogenase family protein, partial [Burkholderiales bacterium]|nr:isocitrate/isopropylmalate dehydrogenase family protein [Burkholderiales bacterium]
RGCERIMRAAFEGAARRRKKVTSITKSNAQQFGMVLWDEVFRSVARAYPDIQVNSLLIDAAAMDFVRKPESFDVVVASNLFGDILSDLGPACTGTIGIAPSANLNPTRRWPSLFEPVHGSAPDIAGQGVANPIGQVWSVAMLLDFLGHRAAHDDVLAAIESLLADPHAPRTPDLGGSAGTAELGQALVQALQRRG